MKYLNIQLTFSEIKQMSKNQLKNIVNKNIKHSALEYLIKLQKSKGKENKYTSLKMAEYLLPNDKLSIKQQIEMFSIRNRTCKIKYNFSNEKTYCLFECGEIETMKHIYNCEQICENIKEKPKYENIFEDNLEDQIQTYFSMEERLLIYRSLQVNHRSSADH